MTAEKPLPPDDFAARYFEKCLGNTMQGGSDAPPGAMALAEAVCSFISDTSLTEQQTRDIFEHISSEHTGGAGQPASLDELMADGFEECCMECALRSANAPAARWLLDHRLADLHSLDDDGMGHLHHAALSARKIALMLIEAGADPKASDHEGDNLFHYLAYRAWDNDFADIARAAKAAGLAPNLINNDGMTPLQKCLANNADEAACWLISAFGFRACCALPDPYREHLAAAKSGQCPQALRLIDEIATAEKERRALQASTGCEQQHLARFGALAQSLIERGLLEIQGQPVRSLDELAELAKKSPPPPSQRPL